MFIHPKTGMAEVYDLHRERWVQVPPVDAREMLKPRGTPPLATASTTHPKTGAGAPSQSLFPVMAPQVSAVAAEGDTGTGGKKNAKPDEEPPAPYDFLKHPMPELRGFAEKANIKGWENMKKDALCEALSLSAFDPVTGAIKGTPQQPTG